MHDEDLAAVQSELDLTSQPFVGRWNQLVSTTNWEKGRIIWSWRRALVAADAPAAEYSDDAWSRLVGGVTSQHVGRLRRVYERFGEVAEQFSGLYWSHFQAALDWSDAEMWLEGAVRSDWSVAQMRRTRWETLGAIEEDRPQNTDIVASELDEDYVPTSDRSREETVRTRLEEVSGLPIPEGPDFGDDDSPHRRSAIDDDGASIYAEDAGRETINYVRPFENLADLPHDLAEAFDAFKLAILRHKTEVWQQISRDDVLASLDALKELALAPSSDDAGF